MAMSLPFGENAIDKGLAALVCIEPTGAPVSSFQAMIAACIFLSGWWWFDLSLIDAAMIGSTGEQNSPLEVAGNSATTGRSFCLSKSQHVTPEPAMNKLSPMREKQTSNGATSRFIMQNARFWCRSHTMTCLSRSQATASSLSFLENERELREWG